MVKFKRVLGIITILALLVGSIPFFTNMSPALAQNGDNEGFSQGLANNLAVLYQQKAALTPVEQKIDSNILQAVQNVNSRISTGKTSNFQDLSTSLLKIDSAGNIEVKLTVTARPKSKLSNCKTMG